VPGRSASFAPPLRSLRLLFKGGNAEDAKTFPVSSYPRRRVSRATGTKFPCCPGPRIRSGVTMGQIQTHPHPEERSVSKGEPSVSTALTAPPSRRRYAPPQDENGAVWNCVCQAAPLPLRIRQYICWPPLIDRVEPVMKPPSSETRNFTPRAISEAWPRRPTGIFATILSSTSAGTARTMSVSI